VFGLEVIVLAVVLVDPVDPRKHISKFGGVRPAGSTPPRAFALPPKSLAAEWIRHSLPSYGPGGVGAAGGDPPQPALEEPVADPEAAVVRGEVTHHAQAEEQRLQPLLAPAHRDELLAGAPPLARHVLQDRALLVVERLEVHREEVRHHL